MSRPTDFTDELAERICDRLAAGETLRGVCAGEGMPDRSTVFRWLVRHETFRDQYARACEVRADAWADELLDIADDGSKDYSAGREVRMNGAYGATEREVEAKFDGEHVQRSKLRVDARKWLMSKAAPKKYGERVDVNHGGQADGAPLEVAVRFIRPPPVDAG